jgi:cation transport regulator
MTFNFYIFLKKNKVSKLRTVHQNISSYRLMNKSGWICYAFIRLWLSVMLYKREVLSISICRVMPYQQIPYQQINELQDSVKEHIPRHVQEIFRAAFNNALEEYGEEERAFRVAWAAVKRDYEKSDDGKWHKKSK